MKHWVRITSLLVVAFMVLSMIAGCGRGGTKVSSDISGSSEATTRANSNGENQSDSDASETSDELSGNSSTTNPNGSSSSAGTKSSVGSKSPSGSSGSTSSTRITPVTEKKLTGKLELQIFVNGSDNNVVWEKTLNAFEDANPDLKVTARIGINVNSQMATRWMSDNPPDFVLLHGNIDPVTYIQAKKFADLTNFMKTATVYGSSEKIWDKLKPDVLTYHNGKIYEAPNTLSGYGLWYDDSYFKQKGFSVPNSYEDLIALAPKANAAGIGAIAYPGQYSHYLVWGMVMPAVAAYGKEFFHQVCTKSSLDVYKSANFKAVWQRLIDLAKLKGSFMSGTVQLNHIQSQMSWLQHKAALISSGSWMESEMKSDIPTGFNMRFTAASLVTADQKKTAILMPSGVAVAEKAKNKDNALAFVRYLYRDEVLLGLMESYGFLSACKINTSKANLTPAIKEMIKYYNNINVINKTVVFDNAVSTEMCNVANAIVLGNLTNADEACQRIYNAAMKNN